jgi:hypothetical protein
VLPTIAVILWAYGMYALVSFFLQRKGEELRGRNRWCRLTWLTVVVCVTAGVGLILWCWVAPGKNEQRLKLAGFLGTVYAEGWPDRVDRPEYPPVKGQNQGADRKPVYALLHPETPASQIEPGKKLPKPRPSRVVKPGKARGAADKVGKAARATQVRASHAKKGKVAAKGRARIKKRSTATKSKKANAG